jgi:hypothetical protein
MTLDPFHLQAAEIALKDMFDKDHFSICDLDPIIKMLGVIPNKKDYQALRCIHCVKYSKMSPEFRNQVMEKVLAIVQSPGFDSEVLNGKLVAYHSSLKQLN